MGGSFSVSLNQEKDLNHFGVCFGWTDRFRLVLAPREIVAATRQLLLTHWIIQEVREQPGFVEFKLKGRPFIPTKMLDISMKYMMCALLRDYYALGWHFKVSADLTRTGSDDSLIFERSTSVSTFVMCLSLNQADRIRVLAPQNLIPFIRTEIMMKWPQGIQREEQIDKSWEFKLKGNPWASATADGPESFQTVVLINSIIAMLYHQGWAMVGAIKSGRSQCDLNSLYFRYEPSVVEKCQVNRFFAVSLNRNDCIRLFNVPQELVLSVKAAILQNWPKGIQKEIVVNGTYEFKIKGNPWWSSGTDAVDSRRLVSAILNTLKQYNWNVYTTCELTVSITSKSVFFFRNDTNENIRPLKPVCISLNESDKIRVINGSVDVMNAVQDSIVHGWPKGIQEQKEYGESFQFQLKGFPFNGYHENPIHSLVTMMHILNNLQNQGLHLICNADVSSKYYSDDDGNSSPLDLSSWFFSTQ